MAVPAARSGPTPPRVSRSARRRALLLIAVVAALGLGLRLATLDLPLDPDEGGYAAVARAWAHGRSLYGQAFVDRPQGLVVLFRLLGGLSYTPHGIRAGALAAGAALTLGSAAAAWAVAGRRAAVVAAAVAAVVGAGPWVQGYQTNGELLAAGVGTAAVALALWWRAGRLGRGWLAAAGALAACAPLVKQTGLDAAVVVLAVTVAGRDRWRATGTALAGACLPVGLALASAAALGWDRWWYAVVGFQRSVGAHVPLGDRLVALRGVLGHAAPDLLVLSAVAVAGLVVALRRGLWPLAVWLAAAALLVTAGANPNPHYLVQLVAPLAVLAGVALAAVRSPTVAAALLAAVLVPPLAGQAWLAAQPVATRARVVTRDDHRQVVNGEVAGWVLAHTAPDDQVYALVASADIYLLADRSAGYPYLWYAMIEHVPGAVPGLRAWLAGADAPEWVVRYQSPDVVDPSGGLAAVLSARYRPAAEVGGYEILARR